jgi:prepilin-type N-terminal cleavage/methylation domain-containing protein
MNNKRKLRRRLDKGFSLLEVIVAMAVLSFGILSLVAVFTAGITFSDATQYDYIAEKKAEQAVEAIFSARNTGLKSWVDIQNKTAGGIFLNGPQPLLAPGPDGLVGTDKDNAAKPDMVIVGPGPDGIMGTADDVTIPLSGMTRQIEISNISGQPNIRKIVVIMRYNVGRLKRTYQLVSYISAFA